MGTMDSKQFATPTKKVVDNEATAITRTKTMNEIIEMNSENIIKQVDPSIPCLRSSTQNTKSNQTDAVVSILKRTKTMNEIITSNVELMQEVPDDSNHFLRSSKIKNLNNSYADDAVPPVKRVRTMNEGEENSNSETQLIARTNTMNEIMSNNNLNMYQYLNETEHFLRSSKSDSPGSTEVISYEYDESNSEVNVKRTRTMDEIMEQNKDELAHDDSFYSLRTKPKIAPGKDLSLAMKSEELGRLDEEYIDMQIQFSRIRRKELESVLGILTKSKLAHKRLMEDANDILADISVLGEGSSHMAKKLQLFRWLNRESVSRCCGLIMEVREMDRDLQKQLDKVENLLSIPPSLAIEVSSNEPKTSTSKEAEEDELIKVN